MVDITAILNVHNEGRLCVPTLRSFQAAVEDAMSHGLVVEALIVADRADDLTLEMLKAYAPTVEFISTDYGDLGLARNAGVKVAAGRYVAFCDADDIWGTSWLTETWHLRPKDDNFVAHPQWWVSFSTDNIQMQVHEHVGMDDLRYDANGLVQFNPWTALCFAPRAVFFETPYQGRQPGIGFEDWQFNATTAAKGVVHVAIPNTYHFIRLRGSGSLSGVLTTQHAVPGQNKYFEKRPTRSAAHNNREMSKIDAEKMSAAIVEANGFEPRLWPLPEALRKWWQPEARCAEPFWKLQKSPGHGHGVMVVLPGQTRGQLFDAVIERVKSLLGHFEKREVVFVVTGEIVQSSSVYSGKAVIQDALTKAMGKRTDVIFMDDIWGKLTAPERIFLLQRFITQNRPEELIDLDDTWLGGVLRANSAAVARFSNIYYFAARPRNHGGQITSPAMQHLPDIFDSLYELVVVDTELKDKLVEAYGLPAAYIRTLST